MNVNFIKSGVFNRKLCFITVSYLSLASMNNNNQNVDSGYKSIDFFPLIRVEIHM